MSAPHYQCTGECLHFFQPFNLRQSTAGAVCRQCWSGDSSWLDQPVFVPELVSCQTDLYSSLREALRLLAECRKWFLNEGPPAGALRYKLPLSTFLERNYSCAHGNIAGDGCEECADGNIIPTLPPAMSKETFLQHWGVSGMAQDKQRLAVAAWDSGHASAATSDVIDLQHQIDQLNFELMLSQRAASQAQGIEKRIRHLASAWGLNDSSSPVAVILDRLTKIAPVFDNE